MKVALLADIHANADALAVVLSAARQEKVQRLLIVGDIVGYYLDAASVLKLLNDWDWVSVRGNHEDMLNQWRCGNNTDAISIKYGTALKSTLQELDTGQVEKLINLPETLDLNIEGRSVRLCHGTPWNRDEYVYPDADEEVKARFAEDGLELVVYGHTHYPATWRAGATLVVNPGSVGQPRDGKPGACWGLWDTDDNTVCCRRESYDMGPLIARCKAHDPDVPFLWTVLTRTQ